MIAKPEKNKKSESARWLPLIVLLMLVASSFLAISNWKIIQKRNELKNRIDVLREEVVALEEKNSQLKEGIAQSQGDEYVEKIARENLGMKKEGEEVLVVKSASSTQQATTTAEDKNFWQKFLEKIGF
jgi:cell division protein FtsB